MAWRRSFRAAAVAGSLAVGMLAAGLLGPASAEQAVAAGSGVGRVGASVDGLTLDGKSWWPAGVNAYQLSTDWSVNRGCGQMVDLDAFFGSLAPNSLTRFNAFQALGTNKFTGELDLSAMDRVFEAAERHGQLIIPVLAPEDGACEDDQFKDRDWFVSGWRDTVASGAVVTFEQWVRTAVGRWGGSPAVAAWELVGEPEPSVCVDGDCSFEVRTCPADAAIVLREFMEDAGAHIRELAPRHLITAGLLGGGQCGTGGSDYEYVSGAANVDIIQYHDYGSDGVALPGDQWNGLARRIDQARAVGKPLLIAEIGEYGGSCKPLAARAASIGGKIAGQRAAGTAGALLWAFVPDPRPMECTMDIGIDDPLFAILNANNTYG